MNALFPGFERKQIEVGGARINLVHGGQGPAVLPGEGEVQGCKAGAEQGGGICFPGWSAGWSPCGPG